MKINVIYVTYVTFDCGDNHVAIGRSGRIVLEIDPNLKKRLYSLLALDSLTLKDWFLIKVTEKINEEKNTLNKRTTDNEI